MPETKAPIPEDLEPWYAVACDGVEFKTGHTAIKTLIERIARLEQENVQLLASHERLREALQRYRRRDDCKCGTCMNADAALREAEKLEGAWTHMRLINAPRLESADDKAEA